MFGVTLAHAFALKPSSPARTIQMFSILGFTALFSWPFAAALSTVLLVHDFMQLKWKIPTLYNYAKTCSVTAGIVMSFLVYHPGSKSHSLAVIVAVDSAAYRKFVVVPWNIVFYNVLSRDGRGPDIFGTEPWSYYFLNLGLNFNIMAIMALASLPSLVFCLLHSCLIDSLASVPVSWSSVSDFMARRASIFSVSLAYYLYFSAP
jgi:alpha-1,2-mannosyltransferase